MKWAFSFPNGGFGKNVMFGADMSSSAHVNNKKKDIFNSWWRSYTRVRWYNADCRKEVFDKFHWVKKEVLFKLAL